MTPETCPACGTMAYRPFLDLGKVPRSGLLLHAPKEAIPSVRLLHEYCTGCGLVRRRIDASTSTDYTNVDRDTRRQLPAYVDEIVQGLNKALPSRDALIVEVGANDGTFLDVLRGAGFNHLLGIEPSLRLGSSAEAKGHLIAKVHLDPKTAAALCQTHGPAAAVVCRHTLEHVADPWALVRAMSLLLNENGVLFVEVPSSRTLIEDLHGHELWDEHLFHFHAGNLRTLIGRAGFRVDSVSDRAHLDGANLLLWARARQGVSAEARSASPQPDACESFANRWRSYAEHLRAQSAHWSKPVLAMGASHPQANFLVFTGLGSCVDMLIDDDPRKVGRYVPLPSPVPVITSQQAVALKCQAGTLLLTAFGYPAWMRALGGELSQGGFRCIDPFAAPRTRHFHQEYA